MNMSSLFKTPLEIKDVNNFLEEEKNFLRGLIETLNAIKLDQIAKKYIDLINELQMKLPLLIDKIFPLKDTQNQIQSLLSIAKIFAKTFSLAKLNDIGIKSKWILLKDGYLGSIVDENYEIAILLYLISAVYQTKAITNVQTSLEYRYYYISALSALKSALAFMEKYAPTQENYAFQFLQMLQLRKLEIEAEVTKAEAFIARKKGDFEVASKLFAGAASFRFSMMNFDLSMESENRLKIYASAELGMACFYIAVGLSNTNQLEQANYYLLKAKSYFENAAKLSENNTELLEAANRRLDLVNPYIDRIKGSIEKINPKKVEEISDPQPIILHPDPEMLFSPGEKDDELYRICSNCFKKIPWINECPKCKEPVIPIE